MGALSSKSIGSYSNDFELVVRAIKNLETNLEENFGSPRDSECGVREKIEEARVPTTGEPLPASLVLRLSSLAKERNKIIHNVYVNGLTSRREFVKEYDACIRELENLADDGVYDPTKWENILEDLLGCGPWCCDGNDRTETAEKAETAEGRLEIAEKAEITEDVPKEPPRAHQSKPLKRSSSSKLRRRSRSKSSQHSKAKTQDNLLETPPE